MSLIRCRSKIPVRTLIHIFVNGKALGVDLLGLFHFCSIISLIVEFQFAKSKEAKLALLRSTLVSTQLIRY